MALSALLRLAFKNELSESSYPEIRSINVDRKGKARIFIAVGARDGYDPRKLVKLLKRECGLSDHNIDDIKVMEDFSFATVPFDQANKVVRALNMLSKGHPIAEIAKDKSGEPAEKPTRKPKSASPRTAAEKPTRAEEKPLRKKSTAPEEWPGEDWYADAMTPVKPLKKKKPAAKTVSPPKKTGAKAKKSAAKVSRRERREQKTRR